MDFWNCPIDPQEPPLVKSRIPLVGHMIGLLWHQSRYFDILRTSPLADIHPEDISPPGYTLSHHQILSKLAFRNNKGIEFEEIKERASCKVADFDQHGIDIICHRPKQGESSYMLELHQEMYGALAQGPSLLHTNARVLNSLARSLNDVGTTQELKLLFNWIGNMYAVGSAEALYGPQNPIAEDRKLIQSIWDFDSDLAMLVLDAMPALTARKGHAARRVMTAAFLKYYEAGRDKNANRLVQNRARCARKWGLTTEEISKAEISILFAAVTNTVPNAFYMLCYILSDPDLAVCVREEVTKIATRNVDNGLETVTLDIAMMQTHCPLLVACFNETLRLVKTGASVRTTLSDVMLNDQYLLKKGAIIQIPTGVLQSDVNTWGDDAKLFNPRRFIAKESLLKEAKKAQSQAFIPFGGGRNLCPGRHLAFTEITGFAAMMVYGFEISSPDGGGLHVPEKGNQNLGLGSTPPKTELPVLLRRRDEFKGVTWKFDVGEVEDTLV